MKYQKILGIVATAGLLLAGCATDSDNNNTWLSDSNAVHVSASVGSIFTRSNPAATDEAGQKSFKSGDVMGVSNNGKSLNYTFNGTDWQPGNPSDYLVWDASSLNFQCWYPADGKNTFSKGYIHEDQSSATEIAKSDYMTAAKELTAIPGDRQLKVAMERKTARLIFNIQSFNDQFDASTKVNHIRMTSKASTDASESPIVNIKPLQNGEGGMGTTYTALVMPGAIEAYLFFEAEGTAETPLVVKTGALEAGKSYTYQLIVGKNKVSVTGITVKDWTTGATIEGGKATWIPYVTFTSAEVQTFKMTTTVNYTISKLEYSVGGNEWTAVEKDKEVGFGGAKGDLRLRGKNLEGTASSSRYKYSTITFTDPDVKVACTGDIRTLLDWESYKTVETKDARFYNLFDDCTALTSAPELPAETLADYCYDSMFYGCSSLQTAPKLPAKMLASYCYRYMFKGCSSLKKAPELPAETLANACYNSMFESCTSLKSAPALPAKTMAYQCYSNMFSGCTSLKTAPKLPATTLASSCYDCMFSNCTNLKTAPELPATTLASSCYFGMFYYCTNLETAPELPATTLASSCYFGMFCGCKILSSITMLALDSEITKSQSTVKSWLDEAAGTNASVTSRTLKVKDKDAYNALVDNSYLPDNWKIGKCTVLDENGMAIE